MRTAPHEYHLINFEKPAAIGTRPAPPVVGDLITDHRARLANEQREARERRRLALAEQSSELNTPEQRIRAWEKLHELTMPRDEKHPLIQVIAADTELSLMQVNNEQRRRAPFAKPARAGAGLSWNTSPVR